MSGVSGEQQEGDYENDAGERQVHAARLSRVCGDVDGPHGHQNFIYVVVKSSEKLRPQKRMETGVLQQILETVLCHGVLLLIVLAHRHQKGTAPAVNPRL